MEVPARTKSGAELRVELSLIALEPAPSGRRQFVLALLHDASERKRAELHSLEAARAEAARKEAARLLSVQSQLLTSSLDELARPLDKLQRSAARLARYATRPDAPRCALLACVVERRAEHVRRTVRHLADASAMHDGTLDLATQRTNLVPLVNRVVGATRAEATAYRFNLALPQGLTAQVDPARIVQVVEALLEQAMQRNPRGCWIDVDLRRPLVGLARLEVRDYGRAASDADRQRLLDANGSSGGLAVSRWLVKQHGGTLTAESPAEGGLRVTVTLPTQRGRVSGGCDGRVM
jgi:two-component system sensor histidine kinase HydH